jgi:Meiotically up-regulated gene 113
MAELDHLYVMQNNYGLIKIGRSVDPISRRRSIESTDQCKVQLVSVLHGAGQLEEEVFVALGRYRIRGEWFSGESQARKAILRKLGLPSDTRWPFEAFNAEAANMWLARLDNQRWLRSTDREFGKLVREMSKLSSPPADPSRWWDIHIWSALWRFEYQVHTIVSHEENELGDQVLIGCRTDMPVMEVPAYTTDIHAAKQLWPVDELSENLHSSAWECCIAGLQARRLGLSVDRLIAGRLDMIS